MDYKTSIEAYWINRKKETMDKYIETINYPYRKAIIESMKQFEPFDSVLEIGCGSGTNLINMAESFPNTKILGVDINKEAIKTARLLLPKANFIISKIEELIFAPKSFDIILTCAFLIYINDETTKKLIKEMIRTAKKGIILVELEGNSKYDIYYHRDYEKIFKNNNTKIEKYKLNELWESPPWNTKGHIYIVHLQ